MANYKFIDFLMNGEVTCDNNYSMDVYKKYLRFFENKSFQFDGIVKSMVIKINEDSTAGATAKVYLHKYTIDVLLSYPEGKMPGPIGELKLSLDEKTGANVEIVWVP
jgi:hypothetical protein